MDTAYFFRNLSTLGELKRLTMQGKGLLCNYSVIGTVCLDKDRFAEFCADMTKGYDFIEPYANDSKVKRGIWRCLRIESQHGISILVMTNGYLYPRFVALR